MKFARGRLLTTLLTALFGLVVVVLAGPTPATAGTLLPLAQVDDYALPSAGADIPTKVATPADNGPHPGARRSGGTST